MYRAFCVAVVVWTSALLAGSANAGVIEGRVIEVPDGGSLTVLSQRGASIHRIRLAGIDAPDTKSVVGSKSRASLHNLVHGKSVQVQTNAIDAWGKLVGKVLIQAAADCKAPGCPDGLDPALVQLNKGQAWIEVTSLLHQTAELQELYAEAEALAKSRKTGFWRDFVLTKNSGLRPRPNAGGLPAPRKDAVSGALR